MLIRLKKKSRVDLEAVRAEIRRLDVENKKLRLIRLKSMLKTVGTIKR